MRSLFAVLLLITVFALSSPAQSKPYFVTYDHGMEEPGNLEIANETTVGVQKHGLPNYWAPLVELEYGLTGWWSTALYLEGASATHDASVFTGYRLENRWKPFAGEHKINPVLYFEFENIRGASRIQKEIVGYDGAQEESIREQHGEREKEIEGKFIFSSNVKGWNIAENFIFEKNLTEFDNPTEFGYAVGVSRPLSSLASGKQCTFCRENLTAGVEFYGGLGDWDRFGLKDTSHYLAPALSWQVGNSQVLRISPGFGLTPTSQRMLLRVGYTYEINGFGQKVSQLFGGKR